MVTEGTKKTTYVVALTVSKIFMGPARKSHNGDKEERIVGSRNGKDIDKRVQKFQSARDTVGCKTHGAKKKTRDQPNREGGEMDP